jgi:hypothetical protein
MTRFYKDLKVGKVWEGKFLEWMSRRFADGKWTVIDTSDVHRDQDGDQFPDFMIESQQLDKYCFVDAKKRNVYKHKGHKESFGFDRNFYNSYTNIAAKHGTKVFVAFQDPQFDPDHVYILDMDLEHDFKYNYGNNGFGEPICYRWYVDNLTKLPL